MNEPLISMTESDTRRRYEARVADLGEEAELELSRVSGALMIAAHTGVPEAMAGRGVGMALVDRLIADARAEGFRIIPLCPFVKAQFGRHPEWADVLNGS